MTALLNWRLWAAVALAAGLAFSHFTVYRSGKAAVRAEWNADKVVKQEAVIAETIANAKETQRRLDRQKANQDAQDNELLAARSAAGRNGTAADELRAQNLDTAKRWRAALSNSPTGGGCSAAGDAIGVFADVLGRADRRASFLASYADTARAAGLKCERDYDALMP